jgi:hypothetical protein
VNTTLVQVSVRMTTPIRIPSPRAIRRSCRVLAEDA